MYTEYNLITFIGMARCGNHGVIHWLQRSFENSLFINNTQGKEIRVADQGRIDNNTPSTVIISLEVEDLIRNLEKPLLSWEARNRVFLLRDPFNTYASKRKYSENQDKRGVIFNYYGKRLYIFTRNWKDHAKEYLGITNHLGDKNVISFNKWFEDAAYREGLLREMGADIYTTDINKMIPNRKIPGSSFDDKKYKNSATQMDVLNRWKYYADDEEFKTMLKDDELMELSYKIFGNVIA